MVSYRIATKNNHTRIAKSLLERLNAHRGSAGCDAWDARALCWVNKRSFVEKERLLNQANDTSHIGNIEHSKQIKNTWKAQSA